MICIAHPFTDPYFNLAAEEYILRNFSDNCFMLWRNEKTIVVGKHQNTLAEINMDFVREKGIMVARRLSGGGTVFHDTGNLNFTFIMNGHEGRLVDFKKYTLPVLEVLWNLSINAAFSGKSDLTIEGKKFSGNAEHVYKKRVLHHGTMLFSSNLDDLELALMANPGKYRSKAVKSIRSRVTNIIDHLEHKVDVLHFRDLVMDHVMGRFPGSRLYELTGEDILKINEIRNEKYIKWEWIFGYSPSYLVEKIFFTPGGNARVQLNVSGGIIQKAEISCNFISRPELEYAEGILTGSLHREKELLEKIKSISLSGQLDMTPEEFTGALI
jgi:lipoate---protein ligase